jgi:hypothetical protein
MALFEPGKPPFREKRRVEVFILGYFPPKFDGFALNQWPCYRKASILVTLLPDM